ncbi:MAG: glycosyltransferase [Bacteroidetes bacterium]|nr:glycosyltransferase [Bacteroidota bacterium]
MDFLINLYILSFIIQMGFWLIVFRKLAQYSISLNKKKANQEPISVIIAGKNEAENILRYLPLVLKQDYPTFEIIFVDDHSTDDSLSVLNKFVDEKLKIYSNLNENKGKKSAIKFGISQAKHELLVFIDADCWPNSEAWLKHISMAFQDKTEIVLGHGAFSKKPGFFNKLIRYENLMVAIQYFSLALIGKPYMGVGRNLAYRKTLFENSSGFENYKALRSGDDDLFVNENANSENVSIAILPESHTQSEPVLNFKSYFFQKRRHLEAGTKYKVQDRYRLALIGLSQLFFYAMFIYLIIFSEQKILVITLFVFRFLAQLFVMRGIVKKLGEKDLLPYFPLLESIYIFLIFLIGASTWVWKIDRWK